MSKYRENQESIEAWRVKTFGPTASAVHIVHRARLEMDELLFAASRPKPPGEIVEEAADVVIILMGVAAVCGLDLMEAVDVKMAVNRLRKWKPAGDGTGHHYHEDETA